MKKSQGELVLLACFLFSPLCIQAQPCAPAHLGLVSWWQAESNALDSADDNNGGLINGSSFDAGKVGQAFNFSGANYVQVPAAASLNLQSFTIETWIFPADVNVLKPIVEYGNGGSIGVHLWHSVPADGSGGVSPGSLYANVGDPFGPNKLGTGPDLVAANQWTHVALTFDQDSGIARLYVNGTNAATANMGSITPPTAYPVNLGYRPAGDTHFVGKMDEVSIYNRALAASELQAISNAGSGGKCDPSITIQPVSHAVTVGDNVSFTVTAAGTAPLSYQWSLNTTNIDGAANSTITLTNVQLSQAGDYSVLVSNAANTVTSSIAVLTINLPPPCTNAPSNVVSWWRAEVNVLDSAGGNDGAWVNGSSFVAGQVGQAFNFSGANHVEVPAAANLNLQSFTIEAWIFPSNVNVLKPIVEYGSGGSIGVHLWHSVPADGSAGVSPGSLYANVGDPFGPNKLGTGPGLVAANQWTHVALTFDQGSGIARIYVNGTNAATANMGSITPPTAYPVNLGYRPAGGTHFVGKMDEVSIYSRALSTNEIQGIYIAGVAGKCVSPVPPFVVTQPTDRTVTVGANTTFNVTGGGTGPLSYQWSFNATNAINGATNNSLTLTNVQISQAGSYSVVVSNAVDSVTSSNAVLTVNFPPASVRVVSTYGAAGEPISVPIILVANGNENALGFSLSFNTQRLTFASVTLGSGAGGGSVLLNTNETGAGRIGVAVSLSSGTNFTAGTQEVARVNFTSAILGGSNSVVSPVTFGNQPTTRQLSDAQAHVLAATYADGIVTLLPSELEGDSAPRPAGDREVTITDWVQVGRFVAGLDIAADGGEFQRADCAPRGTLGDGIFKVTDWVQAGRYASGSDPLTIAGGPTSPVEGESLAQSGGISIASVNRQVMVVGTTAIQGLTVSVPVNLVSQGDETAVGFSLAFNSNAFTYASASLGSGATGATLNLNTSQVAIGKLGMTVGFPSGSFAAGTHELIKVNLIPTAVAVGNNSVAFGNSPVPQAISDPVANELTADYIPGAVTVNPVPSLTIRQSGESVTLAWPLWADGFNLQTSESIALPPGNWTNVVATLQTNGGDIVVMMPASETTKFFRLRHQ